VSVVHAQRVRSRNIYNAIECPWLGKTAPPPAPEDGGETDEEAEPDAAVEVEVAVDAGEGTGA
jgi:hypothetical protein